MENNGLEATRIKSNEILQSCYDYFYRLIPGVEGLIPQLKDNPQCALTDLTDACEGISWLGSAFIGTKDFHNVSVDIQYITRIQGEILEGLEKSDFRFISEALENEFLPMLGDWFDILDKDMAKAIDGAGDGSNC